MKFNIKGKISLFVLLAAVLFSLVSFIVGAPIAVLVSGLTVIILLSFGISFLFFPGIKKLESGLSNLEKAVLNTDTGIRRDMDINDLASTFNLIISKIQEKDDSISKEENKMETMLQALSEAVIALDKSCRILVFNKMAESFSGLTAGMVKGKHLDEVVYIYGGDEKIVLSNYIQKPEDLLQIHKNKGL